MVTVMDERQWVRVPCWVTDIHAFRHWVGTDDCPEGIRTWWLKGEVWIDLSREVHADEAGHPEYTLRMR